MKSFKYFFTFLTLTFLLSACVPNNYEQHVEPVSLLKHAQPFIKTSSVVIGLDPNNINNFIAQQSAVNHQGGLIGYLVTSAIASSLNDDIQQRATLMAPIKQAAIEYNFGSQYRKKLKQNIEKLRWIGLRSTTKAPSFQRHSPEALFHQHREDAIIVSDIYYRMAEDFSKITFTSYVSVFPNNPDLKALAKKHQPERTQPVLYQKMFSYDYRIPGNATDADKAAASWSSNNAELVHKALDQGILQISKLISNDLHI